MPSRPRSSSFPSIRNVLPLLLLLSILPAPAIGQPLVAVEQKTAIRYLANRADPGLGLSWVDDAFDDSAWSEGLYGIGHETDGSSSRADNLLDTELASGSFSIYTRARFTVDDVSAVRNVFLGADYDDGYVAWINGRRVYCSPEMPDCTPTWNTRPLSHESSNGPSPDYGELVDVSTDARSVLREGENVLAVGIWNQSSNSSDLVVVPKLVLNRPSVAVTRGPYLQQATPSGIVVRWRTGSTTDSRVRYGTDPSGLDRMATVGGSRTEHVVEISGLSPDTVYYYTVGSTTEILAGGTPEHRFRTSPLPGTRRDYRVWVIGDSGTANANSGAVRRAYERVSGDAATDVWLMLGDNAYNDGTDAEYQAAVFETYPKLLVNTILWPTLGNHDAISASSSDLRGPYYEIFTLPGAGQAGGVPSGTEAYYSFDVGNIHFICLNSDDVDRDPGSPMLTWLEQDVSSTDQDWVIAYWHHPPYSKGSHDTDNPSDSSGRMFDMRENVLPILEDWGVDLVLTGHSHSYERSFLLDGHYGTSNTLRGSMKLDGGDGRIDGDGAYQKGSPGPASHEGAVYVVAGSSGKTSGGSLDHPAMFLSRNRLGSVILDVSGHRMDLRFIDDNGDLPDHLSLVKNTSVRPGAAFEALPTTGTAPLTVDFTNLSTSNSASWAWDFELDGADDSVEEDPVHTYTVPGTYGVRLVAANDAGSDEHTEPALICVGTTELCNGLDDDCDGATDDGFEIGSPCAVGEGVCRSEGRTACSADGSGVECDAVPGLPSPELCNDLDDDCDGIVDDDFLLDGTCDVGEGDCRAEGSIVCDFSGTGTRCDADFDGDGLGDDCETGPRLADADLSGRVDGFDLARLARAFGLSARDGDGYEPQVDFDRNLAIDGVDLAILASEFGNTVPAP